MPEIHPSDAHLAFLYAGGEMDTVEATTFEQRLGEEQPLREALCQAIELLHTLEERAPLAPTPAYRQRVRQRLRPRGRAYRGHPVLWSGLGAAAALLMILIVSPLWRPAPQAVPVTEQPRAVETKPVGDTPAEPTIEMAETWAELNYSDHLFRAHEEESRRRDRRLAWEEHTHHLPAVLGINH